MTSRTEGNELIQFGAVTKANYTHTGTGTLSWVGDNIGAGRSGRAGY